MPPLPSHNSLPNRTPVSHASSTSRFLSGKRQGGLEEDSADDDVVVYTIPGLIVRDQAYQPHVVSFMSAFYHSPHVVH